MPESSPIPSAFDLNNYLNHYGRSLDFTLYLVSFLASHASADQIPLPLGANNEQPAIPRYQALELIHTYLRENNADSTILASFADETTPLHSRLNLAQIFLTHQRTELLQANLTRREIFEEYDRLQANRPALLGEHSSLNIALDKWRASIDSYVQNQVRLHQALVGSTPEEHAQQSQKLEPLMPPPEILPPEDCRGIQSTLAAILPTVATQLPLSTEPPAITLHKALEEASENNPHLRAFLAYNAAPQQQELLLNTLMETMGKAEIATGISAAELQSQQVKLTQAIRSISLTRSQIEDVLVKRLTSLPVGSLDSQSAQRLAQEVLNASVAAAYKGGVPLSAEELLSQAVSKANIQLNQATLESLTQDIHLDLELHNRTQIAEAKQRGYGQKTLLSLLPGDVRLALQANVDPSTLYTTFAVHQEKEINEVLGKSGFTSIGEYLAAESQKENPDFTLLHKLHLLHNFELQKQELLETLKQKPWLAPGYTWDQARGYISHATNRKKALDQQAWDTWYNFNQNLPHNRALRWLESKQELIYQSRWGWLTNPIRKFDGTWHQAKISLTQKLLLKHQGSTSRRGRLIFRLASLYSQGGYNLEGFSREVGMYLLSKGYHLAKKALGRVLKKVTLRVGAWGMKKLASWGLKSLATAASNAAAPIVGGILLATEIGSLLLDAAKFLWQNKKAIAKLFAQLGAAAFGIYIALKHLIAALLAKLVPALVGVAIGSIFGPLGALAGFFIGFNWASISAFAASAVASIGAFFSSIAAGLASALTTGIAPLFAGIGAAIFTTSILWFQTTSTAQIPLVNKYGETIGIIPGGIAGACPAGGVEVTSQLAGQMDGGVVNLLPNSVSPRGTQRLCIKPTMVVVHWSGGNETEYGNTATFNTLISRDLACQLATDPDDVLLMQPFYEDQVEMAWCSNSWNVYSINNEVAGAHFTSSLFPPPQATYDKALKATCVVMEQYHIPWCQIYGHMDVPDSGGKPDPGKDFLYNRFIPDIRSLCPNDQENVCGS